MYCSEVLDIGVQSFEKVHERKTFYVDKTGFIKEWWETGADVTLITRPRRFGKTLNMSMIECFFSNKYEAGLTAEGISPKNIRKYGFAFEGKRCLIG